MKTILPAFAVLFFTNTAGCGVFGEPDSVLPVDNETPAPNRENDPPPPALEGTPVVSEIDEAFGVFVAPSGKSDGDGTRVRPFALIADGIAAANKSKKRVYVCEGTYREPIAIIDGISMVGGLDCSSPTWSLGNNTVRSRIESPVSPAITATSIASTTRFERFDVSAPDGTSDVPSSIALFATKASSLTIANSKLTAGNGADGADGVAPPSANLGTNANGKTSYGSVEATVANDPFGGAGGVSACGSPAGGAGGTGGMYETVQSPQTLNWAWRVYNNDSGKHGAKPGVLGTGAVTDGADGLSSTGGALTREGYVPGNGTAGKNGSPGRSGNGGAGQVLVKAPPQTRVVWYGIQGTGGGAGGCGGLAGTAGEGGGASIGAFVVDGAVAFVETEVVSKNGGRGGKGSFGAAPTAGGKGGPIVDNIPATAGQDGSTGGLAGVSGNGAGGWSVALVHAGAKPSLDRSKLVVGIAGTGAASAASGTKAISASASGRARDVIAIEE